MDLRLIEVTAKTEHSERIGEILKKCCAFDFSSEKLSNGKSLSRAVASSRYVEEAMDTLERYFSEDDDYRVIILPVETSIPRLEEPEKEIGESKGRISREELYSSISATVDLSKNYLFLIALSSVVAALGMIYGNVAVIIGAMVIAPLLGPNIALAFSAILADPVLAKKAIKSIVAGMMLAVVVSAVVGWSLNANPFYPEIAMRMQISLADIAIAFASGSAGAIAFASGAFLSSLMGVMVAVALIPPLVAFGMLMGGGFFPEAFSALLLLAVNFICINLAGVMTFMVQGIRPRTWWEADRAKRISVLVLIFLFFLIAIIGVIIIQKGNVPF